MCPLGEKMAKIWLKLQENGEKKSQMAKVMAKAKYILARTLLGHMTKMAAMPIYGKNPSKIFFSETNRLISRKLGVKHRWLKYSNVYIINHDPVMTLTKFMARSAWVAYAFELENC